MIRIAIFCCLIFCAQFVRAEGDPVSERRFNADLKDSSVYHSNHVSSQKVKNMMAKLKADYAPESFIKYKAKRGQKKFILNNQYKIHTC